jgi:hypothetical protein
MDLDAFASQLRDEHQRLMTTFETAQRTAEDAWAHYEAVSAELTAFRDKYGKVLRALDEGRVVVEGD